MEWNDRYALGIDQIDHQHQELFRTVNRIQNILQEGDLSRNQRTYIEALRFLKSYTLTHFHDEEAYQQSIHYEDYEHHKKLHDQFRENILQYEEKFKEEGLTHDSIQEFLNTLQFWLINHILLQDQCIAESLRKQKKN